MEELDNNNCYNKMERLKIVLDIINKLKNNINNEITNKYVKDRCVHKGFLDFIEIGKKIEYNFPEENYKKPLFVFRFLQ